MALQVWLPLNGTLENKGLSDINITVTGTTSYTTGKIGNGLNCNGSSYWIIKPVILTNNCSFCFWSKTSDANAMFFVVNSVTHAFLNFWLYNGKYYLNVGDSLNNPFQNNGTDVTAHSDNIWHHYTITFDGTQCLLYIDGNYYGKAKTYRNPTTTSANEIKIAGGFSNGHSYDLVGILNDFRIYDHCLSPKEVHDLALGLVLHYKLDDPYVESTTNLLGTKSNYFTTDWSSYGFGSYGVKSIADEIPAVSGLVCRVTSNSTTVNRQIEMATSSSLGTALSKGDKIVGSVYVKGEGETIGKKGKLHIYSTNGTNTQSNTIKTFTFTSEWQRVNGVYTWNYDTPSGTVFNIYVVGYISEGESFLFSNVQVERKDHVTPFVVNSRNETNVYDCSGYNNDGTIVNTPIVTSPSPRYNVATSLANNSTIKVNDNNWLSQGMLLMTINIWAKATNWSAAHLFSCTESGGFNTEAGNSGYLSFPVNVYTNSSKTSYAYQHDKQAVKIADLSTTDWNMLTFVYSTSGTKTYLNGLLHHLNDVISYGIHFYLSARLFLGCEASGANPSAPYFTGHLSDFRIYTTVLSDDDILDLYKVGASVDNSLNFYTYEIEENGIGRIGKNGVSQFDVLESNDECKIYKLVNSNLFLEEPRSVTPTVYLAYLLNMSENLIAGETYTILLWDIDMAGSASSRLDVYWGGGSSSGFLFRWYVSSDFTNGHADHLVKTFTVTSSQANSSGAQNLWLNLYNYPSSSTDKNMHIGAWKLEKGSAATPLLAEDKLYDTTVQCNQLIEI